MPRVQDTGATARYQDTGAVPRSDTGTVPRFQPRHLAGGPQAQVRGGHPEQREPGGGWGDTGAGRYGVTDTGAGRYGVTDTGSGRYGDWVGASRDTAAFAPPQQPQAPRPRPQQPQPPTGLGVGARIPVQRRGPGPRPDFVEAFEEPRPSTRGAGPRDPYDAVTDWDDAEALRAHADDSDGTAPRSGRWLARTVIGVSAAAVTAALAVMVTGTGSSSGQKDEAAGPGVADRDSADGPSRDQDRTAPQGSELKQAPATSLPYEKRMALKLPMAADQSGPNAFDTVPGEAAAPRQGAKHWRYRVDVEKNLGLDGKFFADAVQRTLNDKRSWAGDGRMSFERVSEGKADFVVTLASPVTTNIWCEKSDLETLSRNVSCDSARTERVMINAFRWAGGSETFGDALLFPYRQMLINHEVGHRLGHNHEFCAKDGALAPVMMQQTKTLETGDKKCRPNAWVHPES
ncbi:hypothetical protein GCM10010329_01590 [Streptomyces spiroverticillatus]|uniref:DUF3152 domain-containing protein n=1 Tax=Streptomyces finlayi TaxID=67296 RepID=A0A918WS58_9ACTN|nr:DUF3152 domain-containing protein [Streptomyces finlayi]GGZ85653.1 hypothetical protein GCM10010329_01590 [Streptomyces spiroverticillatus]GHC77267.1 hypothetical protein GCM10010334_01580 [Streptomyces finlayi]